MTENCFTRRVNQIAVSAIKQMPLFARAVPDAVSLGQGIPSLATPDYIREYVIEALKSDDKIGKYSLQPGMPQLNKAIALAVEARAGRPVDENREVFTAAGAMEALFAAIVSLIDSGDEVLLFDPSYASHIEQVVFAGGAPVYVPLHEEDGWALCVDTLKRSITPRTKAIIVCNPGNPTGKVFTEGELNAIVSVCAEHNLWVITDETYDFLVYDNAPYVSLTRFNEIKDRTIACYSFSKQFAMTGWRVGYMYAPAAVIDQVLKVHDAVMIAAPTVSQYAALAALAITPPNDGRESLCDILKRRRDLTCERLRNLRDLFSFVEPKGAYYVLPRYLKTNLTSHEMALKILHEARVITIPGRAFGPGGEGHIRLSFGAAEDEINVAFDRIERWNRTL
jgi:aminotransferase